MNRTQFFQSNDVQDFVTWLAGNASTITICLSIPKSRFVPNAICTNVTGIGAVLPLYSWKASGMTVGDWTECKRHLTSLGSSLRSSVSSPATNPIPVIRNILAWGGNRDWSKGAFPFLDKKQQAGTLHSYLTNAGRAFALTSANTSRIAPPIRNMNSMLTKVHALYAADGLPIYDSRVAVAIASLVEYWRVDQSIQAAPLPAELSFPAISRDRTVRSGFPQVLHPPPVLTYGHAQTPELWSSAKIRLGWLMDEVLRQVPRLFSAEATLPARMHALEASLFMIGYDAACLRCIRTAPPTLTQAAGF